jgi:hypothetical protein
VQHSSTLQLHAPCSRPRAMLSGHLLRWTEAVFAEFRQLIANSGSGVPAVVERGCSALKAAPISVFSTQPCRSVPLPVGGWGMGRNRIHHSGDESCRHSACQQPNHCIFLVSRCRCQFQSGNHHSGQGARISNPRKLITPVRGTLFKFVGILGEKGGKETIALTVRLGPLIGCRPDLH